MKISFICFTFVSVILNLKAMGYKECLEKAGAEVFAYEEFGSYQGDWLAFVEYNGERGIVQGSYGSCSGCDAFQGEFDYSEPEEYNGKYYKTGNTWDEDDQCTHEEYLQAKEELDKRYADFGRGYLEPLYDKAHYERRLAKINANDEDDWFDEEEKEYCEWAINQAWQI